MCFCILHLERLSSSTFQDSSVYLPFSSACQPIFIPCHVTPGISPPSHVNPIIPAWPKRRPRNLSSLELPIITSCAHPPITPATLSSNPPPTYHSSRETKRTATMDQSPEIDVSKLTQRDREELQQFIVNETQKSKIQQCMCPPPLHRKWASVFNPTQPRDGGAAGNCCSSRRERDCS